MGIQIQNLEAKTSKKLIKSIFFMKLTWNQAKKMNLFAEIEEFPETDPDMISEMLDWPFDADEEIKFEHDFDFQLCFETSPNVECTYPRCTFNKNEKILELDKKLLGNTDTKKDDVKIEPSDGGAAKTVPGSNPEQTQVSEIVEKPATNCENEDPNISTNQEEVMAFPKAPIGTSKSPEKITKKPRNPLKRKTPSEIKCKDCAD